MVTPVFDLGIYMIFLTATIFTFDGVSGDDKRVRSRLYRQAFQENRPLILVLDNSNAESSNDMADHKKMESIQMNKGTQEPLLDLYEMIELMKKKTASKSFGAKPFINEERIDKDRRRPTYSDRKQRFRQWGNKIRSHDHNRYRDNQNINREIQDSYKNTPDTYNMQPRDKVGTNTKSILRSPLFRNFLRYSNSLRCAAKNECAEDCGDTFVGNKKDECEDKCEDKYDCEEPTAEESDRCERGECDESDECGKDGCNISTRGIQLITEKPKCKRC